MIKISVIIPMYNVEKYVTSCLNSVKNQTMKDIEVITINDGSTDKTLEIVTTYQSIIPNLTIINSENFGAGHARNMGLDIATGEYIKFLDADDELASPYTLELMYHTAEKYESDLVIGTYYTHYGKINLNGLYNTLGRPESGIVNLEMNKKYPFQEMPGIGDKLFKRNHIDNLRFPETKWEDLAFTPVLMASAKNLYFLKDTVYHYRMRPNNSSLGGCLFASNIFQFFVVFEELKKNFYNRNIYEQYQQELLGLLAMHGSFDASFVPLWLNMTFQEKSKLLKYFIKKLEIYYPDFRNDSMIVDYYQSHALFKKIFDIADYLSKSPKNLNIDINNIDTEISTFINKSKVLKR